MEQGNGYNVLLDSIPWSKDETEVAGTLLDMCETMLEMNSDLKIPYKWGRKRKRSAILASSHSLIVIPPSYSPKTALRSSNGGCSDGGSVVVVAAAAKGKGEVASPATPLSLSLTESDEKPNDNPLRIKASLKRKREYYLKFVENLNEDQAKLNQELEKVNCYRAELKAFNLKLKERREKLRMNGLITNQNVDPKMVPKNLPISQQIGSQMHQQLVNFSKSMADKLQVPNTSQLIGLRVNQNSGQPKSNLFLPMQPSNPFTSSTSAPLTMVNSPKISTNIAPLGSVVIDLNVSPEELVHVEHCQPLDVNVANKNINRVMAAQARQRRIQINRLKNPIPNNNNNNSKSRLSCRA